MLAIIVALGVETLLKSLRFYLVDLRQLDELTDVRHALSSSSVGLGRHVSRTNSEIHQ